MKKETNENSQSQTKLFKNNFKSHLLPSPPFRSLCCLIGKSVGIGLGNKDLTSDPHPARL